DLLVCSSYFVLVMVYYHSDDSVVVCFFFQAEDGIRDRNVTGVQTCALPIFGFSSGGEEILNLFYFISKHIHYNGLSGVQSVLDCSMLRYHMRRFMHQVGLLPQPFE